MEQNIVSGAKTQSIVSRATASVWLVMMIMISVGECNERVLIAELRDGHPAIILTLYVSNAVTLGPCNVMPTILM